MDVKLLNNNSISVSSENSYVVISNGISWIYLRVYDTRGNTKWLQYANGSKAFENQIIGKTELQTQLKKFVAYNPDLKIYAIWIPWGEDLKFILKDEASLLSMLNSSVKSHKKPTAKKAVAKKRVIRK